MKGVCLIKLNQMKPLFTTYFLDIVQGQGFGFPYFNQFLKFLQRFTVFNILRYHGLYLGS